MKVLLIELNEFSSDLFSDAVKQIPLPNIEKLLALNSSLTQSDELTEHRGLDPWVQWVSIHVGQPYKVHQILHLGDAVKKLKHPQLWEVLSEFNISSGIWGAMNATRSKAKNCLFFLPDPWTYEENAYPADLNNLLALPRYYSKNYLDLNYFIAIKACLKLSKFIFMNLSLSLFYEFMCALKSIITQGLNNAVLFSLFDIFSAEIFLKYTKKFNPSFTIIFLNSIAHLQHHKWKKSSALTRELKFGLASIDRILGRLFEMRSSGYKIVAMNGLGQKNVADEPPRICYRQINPELFLRAIKLIFQSVEQLMTNDAHIMFLTENDRDVAKSLLSEARLQKSKKKLFHVLADENDCHKLFFQVDIWDPVDSDDEVYINSLYIPFYKYFEGIVARTGAHIPLGNIYYDNGLAFPATLKNFEVAGCLISQFQSNYSKST
jgi:hypothetical protein